MLKSVICTLTLILAISRIFTYEMVYPSIVNRYGEFQSSNLSAYESYISNNSLWIQFSFENETILIGLSVRRHSIHTLRQCQFRGTLNQDFTSQAAFSLCNGLVSKYSNYKSKA